MLDKIIFQKCLEEIGTKYFLENNGVIERRGGNSNANESYFRFVRKEVLERSGCGVLILGRQECPDSGIFAEYGYLNEKDVDWNSVSERKIVAIKMLGDLGTYKYFTFPSLILQNREVRKENFDGFVIDLNKQLKTNNFFGVEYKACKNDIPNSVSVASFNCKRLAF